jgi:ankyrin repeat protein
VFIEGQNALHAAAKIGWLKIAKFLIDNGIQQELPDSSGRTPFIWAMARYPAAFNQTPPVPNMEMVKLLQEECLKIESCEIKDAEAIQ